MRLDGYFYDLLNSVSAKCIIKRADSVDSINRYQVLLFNTEKFYTLMQIMYTFCKTTSEISVAFSAELPDQDIERGDSTYYSSSGSIVNIEIKIENEDTFMVNGFHLLEGLLLLHGFSTSKEIM